MRLLVVLYLGPPFSFYVGGWLLYNADGKDPRKTLWCCGKQSIFCIRRGTLCVVVLVLARRALPFCVRRFSHSVRSHPVFFTYGTLCRVLARVLGISKAELDDMSGTLHCEEGDYKTSFSYFLESYEAFDSQEDVRALRSLKVYALVRNIFEYCVDNAYPVQRC